MTNQFQSLKAYVFPALVSILGMMIWNDVTEIKADVKALMAQSNIDKTRIDALERVVYSKTTFRGQIPPRDNKTDVDFLKSLAVKPEDEEDI